MFTPLPSKVDGSQAFKHRATSPEGARRIVYFQFGESPDMVLALYRSKSDDVGKNVAVKNPHYLDAIKKAAVAFAASMLTGEFDCYEKRPPAEMADDEEEEQEEASG